MQVARSIGELRQLVSVSARPLGFVPTMGALHEGHGRLIFEAHRHSAAVAVSIFVNPIQFNQSEDYQRYPRPVDDDLAFCERHSVNIVFAPSLEEMYPESQRTFVGVAGVSEHMEGQFRPGHFRGVATVVMKLLQIVQPDRAFFGEKDAQQLAVVRRMVRDLNVPVEIVGVETVREADGLALSSRNRHLTSAERQMAPLIYQALCQARQCIEAGEADPQAVMRAALALLNAQPEFRVEYIEVADEDMQPVQRIDGPVRVAAAVWLGKTRLIDNMRCIPRAPRGDTMGLPQ